MMIHAEELEIGNRVFWKPYFSNSNVLIQVEITSVLQDKVGYIRSHFEHRVEPFEELIPIPLTETSLKKLNKKIKYPKWIQYLHELQNWYYWDNEKKELEIND